MPNKNSKPNQKINTIVIFASIIAALAGLLADRLGRKRMVVLAAILYLIGSIASALSPSAFFLQISRFILGLAIGERFRVCSALYC